MRGIKGCAGDTHAIAKFKAFMASAGIRTVMIEALFTISTTGMTVSTHAGSVEEGRVPALAVAFHLITNAG